jgi:hypothetical protein
VDVYLLPAVVGGGLGDIEEVLAAGRELARAGFPTLLYRRPGHPLPRSVDGPWDWPRYVRLDRLRPRAPAALTISPAWGISAAPTRNEAFGRGGPWEVECADIERTYGPRSTLHVSLEEFARTLPSVGEDRERLREGGIGHRDLGARLRRSRREGELERFRAAFHRFRAFDRPNVLHVFAGFERNTRFAREFPNAVQTGPLWSRAPTGTRARARSVEWVWYASPASAEHLAFRILEGLSAARSPRHLYVRSPRPWKIALPSDRVELDTGSVRPAEWRRRFAGADLRIVTGSRTLLEALELGRPFLYFNGTLGAATRTRRHRPEKIVALLSVLRQQDVSPDVIRDLSDFARGRRVPEVVRRAADRSDGWSRFPRRVRPVGFRAPYEDAGRLIVRTARALARAPRQAEEIVDRVRAGTPL